MSIGSTPNAMDFAGLAALRSTTKRDDPEVLREVARQFESLFTNMMLKNMRAASLSNPLTDSKEQDTYFEMFDQQMAVEMSRGRGLGIADMLVRQLSGTVSSTSNAHALPGIAASKSTKGFARETLLPEAAQVSAPSNKGSQDSAAAGKLQAEDFARAMWPHAREAADELGVDPRVIVAQAALETGWGRRMPDAPDGSSSNNLFGIKADQRWSGRKVVADTMEFSAGALRKERASFRAYDSFAQSMHDYVSFLKDNPRYTDALAAGENPEQFARELQNAGYATDPDYADKILSILSSGKLDELNDPLKFSAKTPITMTDVTISMPERGVPDATGI